MNDSALKSVIATTRQFSVLAQIARGVRITRTSISGCRSFRCETAVATSWSRLTEVEIGRHRLFVGDQTQLSTWNLRSVLREDQQRFVGLALARVKQHKASDSVVLGHLLTLAATLLG